MRRAISCGAAVLWWAGAAAAQPPGGDQHNEKPGGVATRRRNEVKIEVRGAYRYITSNGIPDHATGKFPNHGNPSAIAPQQYRFRVPVVPQPAAPGAAGPRRGGGDAIGVAVNGVPFDPGTAEFWHGDPRWKYEALTGVMGARGGLGVDEHLAHVQPNGAYHYHGLPTGLLKNLDAAHRVVLVGWAADGYPIYGPQGRAKAEDPASPLKELKSSYRLRPGNRPAGADGPGGAIDGSFASDYEWVEGHGDLDRLNGRTGVTPEFPNGTYHYVLTADWPFMPRALRGTPDPSFQKGPPGGAAGKGKKGMKKGPPGEGFGGPPLSEE